MKLSVVMVTYNHERFIAHALSSVLAQRTNVDFEIIVAEDCSTDGTRAIVMDFARRYPGKILPLLRERNLGMMRNFLDAHPDHAVCCARAQFVDETAGGQSGIYPGAPSGSYTIADLIQNNFIVTGTVMYRWGSVGPLPDWFLTLKLADWPLHILVGRSGKIHLMDEVMGVYRIHSGGAWSSLSRLDHHLAFRQMFMALEKHLDPQYTNLIRQKVARACLDLAITARSNCSRWQTVRYLLSYARNGSHPPGHSRLVAGLATYVLVGSWYKIFSRAKQADPI